MWGGTYVDHNEVAMGGLCDIGYQSVGGEVAWVLERGAGGLLWYMEQ